MTTSTVSPQIAEFAAAVRAALADLPAEERDELTDGLEADLSESLAEDLRRTLPDPIAYAAELRAAAGLPMRVRQRGTLAGLTQGWHDTLANVRIAIRRNPALGSLLDFAITLRPAWWILRAWIATWIVAAVLGRDSGFLLRGAWWIVLAVAVVVSAQWGRGRWRFRGLGPIIVIGNVIALVALVPVVSGANTRSGDFYSRPSAVIEERDLTGVYLNGNAVTNIFGFDAKGRPLNGVQLFDQHGNPLATALPGADGCLDSACSKHGLWVPATLRNGVVAWNVFPMQMIEATFPSDGVDLEPVSGASPQNRHSPFVRVPALLSHDKVAKSDH